MPVCFSSDILSCMRWRQRLGFSQAYFSFVLENGGDGVRSQHTFSVKGDTGNVLGLVCQRLSVVTTELCHCSMETATGNT